MHEHWWAGSGSDINEPTNTDLCYTLYSAVPGHHPQREHATPRDARQHPSRKRRFVDRAVARGQDPGVAEFRASRRFYTYEVPLVDDGS